MIRIRAKLLAIFLSGIFALTAVSLSAAFLINRLTQNTAGTKFLSGAGEEIIVHAAGIINLSSLYRIAETDKQAALKAEYEFSKKRLGEAIRVLKDSGKFSEEIPFLEKNSQEITLKAEKVVGLTDARLEKEEHFSGVLTKGLRENRHKVLDGTGSGNQKNV